MKIEDIKVGMTLRRVRNGSNGKMNQGDTGVVVRITSTDVYFDIDPSCYHHPHNLELVSNPKPAVLPIFN